MNHLDYDLVQHLKKFVLDERRALFEEKIQHRTKHITIVLENIFQGRNISASIRSADCFGVQDVHVIENDNVFNDDSEVSMGAEVNGCSEQSLKLADERMKIPMYGFTESFNISVSVSLCLQHLTYKMRNSAVNWRMNQEQRNKTLLQWLRNSIKSSSQIEEKYLKLRSEK